MGLFDKVKSALSAEQQVEESTKIKLSPEILQEFQNGIEGQLKIIEARII